MGQHAQVTLVGSGPVGAGSKTGAKPTLEAGDDAFNLPAPVGFLLRRLVLHLPPAWAMGNCFGTAPVIDGNDGLQHTQIFSTEPVVSFAIVSSVGVEGFDLDAPRRRPNRQAQVVKATRYHTPSKPLPRGCARNGGRAIISASSSTSNARRLDRQA